MVQLQKYLVTISWQKSLKQVKSIPSSFIFIRPGTQFDPLLSLSSCFSIVNCQVLAKWLTKHAAPSNPSIKFIQILSTRCIQNYPDANLPTILLYRLGAVQKQILQADIIKTQELINQILETEKDQQQNNTTE